MGTKLLWSGLTIMLAVTPILDVMGLNPDVSVISAIGGAIMILGAVLVWLSK